MEWHQQASHGALDVRLRCFFQRETWYKKQPLAPGRHTSPLSHLFFSGHGAFIHLSLSVLGCFWVSYMYQGEAHKKWPSPWIAKAAVAISNEMLTGRLLCEVDFPISDWLICLPSFSQSIHVIVCLSVCLSLTEIYQIRLDGRAEGNGIGFSLIKRPLSYINQSIVTFQALCFESPSSLRLSVTTLSLSLFLLALHISKEKTRGAC